jgi:hypothetical protein
MYSDPLPSPVRKTARSASGTSTIARGALEKMPKWLICVPLVLQWVGLAIRYRSATLPSAANPCLTSGGMVGEGKLEYFDGMGPVAREVTAAYCAVPTGPVLSQAALAQRMEDAALAFPVVVKPDLGLCGYGVRRVDSMQSLQDYLARFPAQETVVVQAYLPHEHEAGIFYARDPGAEHGQLIGLALRYFPRVTGDGRRSVAQLMQADPRSRRAASSAAHECAAASDSVPAAGEVVRLATVGSTRVGGLYRDGAIHITPRLSAAIDAVARDMPSFHCGRFDVRFSSLAELEQGRGFVIMEINGAGSEAIQAWDPGLGLLTALRMIFAKQRVLFAIGDAMRRRGARPVGLLRLARLNWRQQRLIARYPPSN